MENAATVMFLRCGKQDGFIVIILHVNWPFSTECDLGDDSESSSEDCNEKGGDDSAGLAADDVGMPSTVNHQGLSPVQHPSAELDRLSLSQHPQV